MNVTNQITYACQSLTREICLDMTKGYWIAPLITGFVVGVTITCLMIWLLNKKEKKQR